MAINTPAIQLNGLYLTGFEVAKSSTTSFLISKGICRDSTNTMDLAIGYDDDFNNVTEPPISLNLARTGANGLDTGTLAASSWYSIYIIGSSRNLQPTAAIATLSSNAAPALPVGYDVYRKRSVFVTHSDSSIIEMDVMFNGNQLVVNYLEDLPLLSSGNATSFTNINLNAYVPLAPKVIVNFGYSYAPTSAGNSFNLLAMNSLATNGQKYTGAAATVDQSGQGSFFAVPVNPSSTTMAVKYKVSSGTLNMNIYGFTLIV